MNNLDLCALLCAAVFYLLYLLKKLIVNMGIGGLLRQDYLSFRKAYKTGGDCFTYLLSVLLHISVIWCWCDT